MKRILSIFILLLYTLASSGVGIQTHWCGKKISHIKVVFTDKHSCPCGSKKMKADCCKDKIEYLKVTSSHQGSSLSQVNIQITDLFILSSIFTDCSVFTKSKAYNFSQDHAPPLIFKHSLYIENRTIRI